MSRFRDKGGVMEQECEIYIYHKDNCPICRVLKTTATKTIVLTNMDVKRRVCNLECLQ